MFTDVTQRRSFWEKAKETGNPSSTKSTTKNKNLFPEMEERNTACARLYHLIFGKNKLVIIAITLEEQVNKSIQLIRRNFGKGNWSPRSESTIPNKEDN